MFSLLKPSLLYTDVSQDVTENDEDFESTEWVYSEVTVYRGALNTEYLKEGLDVYSLYNDNSERIGLAEHSSDNHSLFKVLWFSDNPWNMLFQEEWKQTESIYTLLSPEAYQDSIDINLLEKGCHRIVLPSYIINGFPDIYECDCNVSFLPTKCSSTKKKVSITNPLFLDDSFIMYIPPSNSKIWSMLDLQQRVSSSEEEVHHHQH